ncbi:RDD family protein [Kitasatospora sp. NPDC002227]|uniref:RDD family protein n=1 Tax=Kitasatospora sp. NPDC002227 TaxID=3154773 RepID=UPI00332C9D88
MAVSGIGRRGLAWLVDFALVIGLACLLAVLTFHRIGALLTDVPSLAAKGGWGLLTSHGDYVGTGEKVGISLWHSAVSDVQQGFAALVVCTFLYQFLCIAFGRRTLGKLMLGLQVLPAEVGALGKGRAAARALVTTVADVALISVALAALVRGSFVVAIFCWALAIAGFWANALPVLFPGRRSLADRLARTVVAATALPTWQDVQQSAQQTLQQSAAYERLRR